MSPSIPGPWKGSQILFYGIHTRHLPFPVESGDTAPSYVLFLNVLPCQDHYVVQCAVGESLPRGAIQAVSTSTRPPLTRCWPRVHTWSMRIVERTLPSTSPARPSFALIPYTNTRIAFFTKKDPIAKKKMIGRAGKGANTPFHQLFRPPPHREARHSGPCLGDSTSASQLPQWHKGEHAARA